MTIAGNDPHLTVDAADDDFHRPTVDDPSNCVTKTASRQRSASRNPRDP